jgi:hypothetical protein
VSRLPLLFLLSSALLSTRALAQDQDAHRAVIQRDQQSAEFAARMRGEEASRRLEALHEQQNRELAHPVAPELQPYQREKFSQERSRIFQEGFEQRPPQPEKSAPVPDSEPLPLPGGLPRGVDPVVPQGLPD